MKTVAQARVSEVSCSWVTVYTASSIKIWHQHTDQLPPRLRCAAMTRYAVKYEDICRAARRATVFSACKINYPTVSHPKKELLLLKTVQCKEPPAARLLHVDEGRDRSFF